MTQTKFTYVADNNKKYEIYNTTENMIHAVLLNKKGEKCIPNVKTLLSMSIDIFNFGIKTTGIVIN